MPIKPEEFGSIVGPTERGIDSFIEESDNKTTINLARAMKILLELIKKQGK